MLECLINLLIFLCNVTNNGFFLHILLLRSIWVNYTYVDCRFVSSYSSLRARSVSMLFMSVSIWPDSSTDFKLDDLIFEGRVSENRTLENRECRLVICRSYRWPMPPNVLEFLLAILSLLKTLPILLSILLSLLYICFSMSAAMARAFFTRKDSINCLLGSNVRIN